MPNFDTGHYFLTTLAPIKTGATLDQFGMTVSHRQNLRILLSALPTALQSPATEQIGINSPFANNRQTHLCRFVVIDDVVYNSRERSNPVINGVTGTDPITPQKVDDLANAYLMFAVDVDAVMNEGDPLPARLSEDEQNAVRDAYARRLWQTMELELRQIYSNCVGFDDVNDADGFARYLRRCQIETTMPFNDYWLDPPALQELPVLKLALLSLVPLAFGLIAWLFGASGLVFWGGLLLTFIALVVVAGLIMSRSQEPMPPGQYGDLPSVLKGLYLQRHFTDFAIDIQGRSDAELHASFGAFIKRHAPDNKMEPSQKPGVIAS